MSLPAVIVIQVLVASLGTGDTLTLNGPTGSIQAGGGYHSSVALGLNATATIFPNGVLNVYSTLNAMTFSIPTAGTIFKLAASFPTGSSSIALIPVNGNSLYYNMYELTLGTDGQTYNLTDSMTTLMNNTDVKMYLSMIPSITGVAPKTLWTTKVPLSPSKTVGQSFYSCDFPLLQISFSPT